MLLLFGAGIWCGRKSRFLWLCLSCFGFDMMIHLILGFGINEVFIMAPHFMFVLPIATAYLLKNHGDWHNDRSAAKIRVPVPVILRLTLLLVTLYLFIYNGYLLTDFLLTPIRITL